MTGIIESLSTINSLVRTALAVLLVALLAAAGWYGYQTYNANDLALKAKDEQLASIRNELAEREQLLVVGKKQIAGLTADLQVKEAKIQKLDTSLRLLKVNHRVAWLTVLEQDVDPDTNELYTMGQFVEVNDKGEVLGAPKRSESRATSCTSTIGS